MPGAILLQQPAFNLTRIGAMQPKNFREQTNHASVENPVLEFSDCGFASPRLDFGLWGKIRTQNTRQKFPPPLIPEKTPRPVPGPKQPGFSPKPVGVDGQIGVAGFSPPPRRPPPLAPKNWKDRKEPLVCLNTKKKLCSPAPTVFFPPPTRYNRVKILDQPPQVPPPRLCFVGK